MANHKTGQMTLVGVIIGVFGASIFSSGVWIINQWARAAMMCSGLAFMFIAVVYFYMSSLDPARSHSLLSQWQDLFRHLFLKTGGRLGYAMLRSSAKDVISAQLSQLQTILKINANCEFGEKYKLAEIDNIDDFRKRLPLTQYEDIKPMIEGVMKGYQSLNTADKVIEIACEAADGDERFFSVTDTLKLDMKSVNVMMDFQRRRNRKYDHSMAAVIDIRASNESTEGGLPITDMNSFLTSYMAISLLPDECYRLSVQEQYYLQALVCIGENQISSIEFSSVEVMEKFFSVIIEHQVQLSVDLKRTHLNKDMGFSERIRSVVDGRLVPMKGRHLELKRAIETGEEHLALKLWLGLKYVTVRGGLWRKPNDLSMAALKDVKWERTSHVIPQGIIGFSINNHDPPRYVFAFATTFFEFIKVDDDGQSDGDTKTWLLHEIEEGVNYEVVVTTQSGLYRYRTGKYIQVCGHWMECPSYVRL